MNRYYPQASPADSSTEIQVRTEGVPAERKSNPATDNNTFDFSGKTLGMLMIVRRFGKQNEINYSIEN
ncbi:MAG: hypothetical protein LBR10_10560 [Prevotellaceae bacterium]|jgi:hypothetical protein|nr:hypothetical protein [Prevotellaceae bacterium]